MKDDVEREIRARDARITKINNDLAASGLDDTRCVTGYKEQSVVIPIDVLERLLRVMR